ncbi:segregation and condensation protein A [Bacilli bacterium PM5-3]|nr:segregation and condensation protein A [Bacilli bacterium PM5-3]MDH6604282.1 segregation and condensation protein A [Bacilli bacterium PM5-9]
MERTYKINDFEGPLDLLLHLIKENKMSIFDIEITTLTAQYLELVEEAKTINLEIASDFLVMASTLLEIKSKSLLPKPEIEIDDEYQENTQDELVKRLLEYKRYKEVSENLKEFNETRNLIYTKPIEDLSKFKTEESILDIPHEIELYDLIRSMDKMLQRLKFKKPLSSVMENNEISVEARCTTLLEQINKFDKKNILLDDLIDIPTKSYMIVTFLAMLDLAKRNLVKIKQSDNFDEIYINGVI